MIAPVQYEDKGSLIKIRWKLIIVWVLMGNESFYGLSIHPMLVLRALDIIHREVILTDEVID
jgi:hypothetical protein